MRRLLIFGSIIGGILGIILVLNIIPFHEIVSTFSNASWKIIVLYLLVSISIMLCLVLRWSVVLRSQNIKVPFHRLIAYHLSGFAISYLTPTAKLGGEPVKAGLLTNENIKFRKALSSVVISKTIEVTTSSLFFFIGVIAILATFALPTEKEIFLIIFATAFLATAMIFFTRMMRGKGVFNPVINFFHFHKTKWYSKHKYKIKGFERLIIKFYREDRKHFTMTVGISLLAWILMFAEFKLALLILGYSVNFTTIFLIVSFIGAAVLVPVPMAMGALEASQIAAFSIISIKSSAAVALAFLVRARDLVWTLIGIGFLSYYGARMTRRLKNKITRDVKDDISK